MAPPRNRKQTPAAPTLPSTVCYCDGEREIGTLELFCTSCLKWFHGRCLRQLKDFYGLSFMVCYVYQCEDCSPTREETWTPRQANFIHMLVTVLSNLTCEAAKAKNIDLLKPLTERIFFNLEDAIIPYFETNWEHLTSMPRRVKTTWHQTLQSTLMKQGDLFTLNPADENGFAMLELDLSKIGPAHEGVRQIGKKTPSSTNLASTLVAAVPVKEKVEEEIAEAGPKTRGAKRRTATDGVSQPSKKGKYGTDSVQLTIAGRPNPIECPLNKDGYRYFLVEKDPNVPDKEIFEQETESASAVKIREFLYRVSLPETVTMSPNDRGYQLRMHDDQMTVTGHEGYCVARASHSVAKGTWYFEVNFLKQPGESHVRIGWSQPYAVLQACLGYTKFSYSWRSHKGTKFHEAHGKTYQLGGYQEGDVLGCLIHLPLDPKKCANSAEYLPASYKDIEFFHNGKPCGVAFTDIYAGFYHPAVSIFHEATVQSNFGPKFKYPVKGARAFCERAEETQYEHSLSDLLALVENEDERAKAVEKIRAELDMSCSGSPN
ncbi:unnamed protein product, partial [Mesorhabditis spiculigera]